MWSVDVGKRQALKSYVMYVMLPIIINPLFSLSCLNIKLLNLSLLQSSLMALVCKKGQTAYKNSLTFIVVSLQVECLFGS